MTAISISLSGVTGVDWPRWQQLATEVEALGFAGLYRYDHFAAPTPPPQGGPENDNLDLTASLTWLASHTQRIRFGPLVAPFSIHDPHLLVRQATAIDDLSGGRFVLGVGAGWMEREHTVFGYELGDIPTRMVRFEEGLAVIAGLLPSSAPLPSRDASSDLHSPGSTMFLGHNHFDGVQKGDAMSAAAHIASPLSRTYPVASCGHFYADIISQATATIQKGNPLSSPIKTRSLLHRHELPSLITCCP